MPLLGPSHGAQAWGLAMERCLGQASCHGYSGSVHIQIGQEDSLFQFSSSQSLSLSLECPG